MPELPEVQTVLSTLKTQIDGLSINDVFVFEENIVQNETKLFINSLINQQFKAFHRKGKYLVFELSDTYLVVHLRMEGRFFLAPILEKSKHVHVVFALSDGRFLHYQDTRKFGRMKVLRNEQEKDAYLSHLGMDGVDLALDGAYLRKKAKNKTRSLKSFLLAQENVAGVGNIYADEICFYVKLHPSTPINKLSNKQFDALACSIRHILTEAIALGGSSIRSYTDSLGISGRFQLQLNVHMRKDQRCYTCDTPIIKTVVANRGTYLCQTCQKLKK